MPERLRKLNYVIFGEGQSFARPLTELVGALRQDVDWIRLVMARRRIRCQR